MPTPRLLGALQINKKDFFNIGFMLRRTFSPFFFSLIKHDAPRRMPSGCESHACFFFFGCWVDMSASCCLRFYCLNPKIKNKYNKKQKGEIFLYSRELDKMNDHCVLFINYNKLQETNQCGKLVEN